MCLCGKSDGECASMRVMMSVHVVRREGECTGLVRWRVGGYLGERERESEETKNSS